MYIYIHILIWYVHIQSRNRAITLGIVISVIRRRAKIMQDKTKFANSYGKHKLNTETGKMTANNKKSNNSIRNSSNNNNSKK